MTTVDSPAPSVFIAQPARGFRYTSDAMWLVGFALESGVRPGRALDIGTGSGVVAMLLGAHGFATLGIDHRPEWLPLWATTLSRSQTAAPVELCQADVRTPLSEKFELVVANPPYFAMGTGPVAPDPWKRAARTESSATLRDFLDRARASLAPSGRVCLIVPREREREILAQDPPVERWLLVERWLRIGRRRSLFCLTEDGVPSTSPEEVSEGSERACALVAAATRPGR